jgi:NAD-dependent dihydropyrimidine dehydrogenase PreA subunit
MRLRRRWKGVPREQVPWHPTVEASSCVGCRKCFEFCSHGVYAWDEAADRPVVAEPFRCVVGCSNCMHQCDAGAITFPPLTILKGIGSTGG